MEVRSDDVTEVDLVLLGVLPRRRDSYLRLAPKLSH